MKSFSLKEAAYTTETENELAVNIESYSVWVRPGEMKTGKDEAEKQKNYEDTIAKTRRTLR